MPVMNMFPGGSTMQIPLDAPTSFSATAGNAQVELTWTDPLDKYATPEGEVSETGDQLVSEWDHTVLVRKTGSQPAGPNDGTVVVSSSVRNQYQTTAYVDSGLTNDTTYYYGVFAYNKDGVASPGAFVNATPMAGTPLSQLAVGTLIKILENGSPVEFYLAKHNYEPSLNGEGRELVVRKELYNYSLWNTLRSNKYASSTIDRWLNNTYKNLLSSFTRSAMNSTFFYSTVGGGDYTIATIDRSIFILSLTELGKSESYVNREGSPVPIASTLRVGSMNGEAVYQNTRSPVNDNGNNIICLYPDGENTVVSDPTNSAAKTRPCFTLPNTALVDADLNLIES